MKHEEKLIEDRRSAVEEILRLAKNAANKILSLIRGVFSLICSIFGHSVKNHGWT